MSASHTCRNKGFTIIELLIVVAIIVALAASGLGVAFYMIKRAKMMNALAACTELQQGIDNFFSHHDQFPIEVNGDMTISSNSPEGLALLRVLLNEETDDPKLNTKRKSYLNIKQGERGVDGILRTDSGELEGLADPWGGDYHIRLDGDFNGEIEVKPKGSSSVKRIKRSVVVWTDGADGVDGTGDSKDDVTTW